MNFTVAVLPNSLRGGLWFRNMIPPEADLTQNHTIHPQDFLIDKASLQARRSYKWRHYPADVLPAFVADMDFKVAPAVQAAILETVEAQDYGYPLRGGDRPHLPLATVFAERMALRYGWTVPAGQVIALADLVQGINAAILAFSEPGDGVIVQVPNYPPFRESILATGRALVPLQMVCTENSYVFDLETLEAVIDERTRIFVLCNPQNPTGRAFSRAELEAVLAFAERHDLIVLSDEIHADLLYPGARHIPFASLSAAAESRTITLSSATKGFNIPGLRCAVAAFGSDALLTRFYDRVPARVLGSVNHIGIDATIAAWTQGQAWLDGVLTHLHVMREHVAETLRRELPTVRFHLPDATYLLWLDCSDLGIEGTAHDFFLKHARVGFSPGEAFHPDGAKHVRMNFATSKPILDEILERMVKAARANQR